MSENIIIIGAGQAGAQAAISARAAGFQGAICVLGDEPALPYQRPPLSKAFLQGDLEEDRLFLRPQEFYDAHSIDLRCKSCVTSVDRPARTIVTSNGEQIAYDQLLFATGAPPRRISIPGAHLPEIFYLRSIADARKLRPALAAGGRLCVIGAGYVGLEVAASARKAGLEVVVIEMADRVLARVASEPLSTFYQALHREKGVDLRLQSSVVAIEGDARVRSVRLANGEIIDCNAVVVGIGAVPQVKLAADAGVHTENGIATDDYGRTSDPVIFAAGDCASHPSALYEKRLRLESVPNAIEQAKSAGSTMAGVPKIYNALPWFWSDQFTSKLQTAGLSIDVDEIIVRGDSKRGVFSVWSLSAGRLMAVDAVNDPIAFVVGKKLVAAKATPSTKSLADSNFDLKSLNV